MTVSILPDAHSKHVFMHTSVYCQIVFFSSAVVTIGFNTVAYTVLEDAGSVNVTASILNGTLARNVVVTLSTKSDSTATGKFNIL